MKAFFMILVHFPTVQHFPFPSDAHEQHSRMLIVYNRIFTFFLANTAKSPSYAPTLTFFDMMYLRSNIPERTTFPTREFF